MKRLKQNQLGPWCEFCEPKTARASYSGRGFSGFACNKHREDLRATEEKVDDYMSEGDYQSWGRL